MSHRQYLCALQQIYLLSRCCPMVAFMYFFLLLMRPYIYEMMDMVQFTSTDYWKGIHIFTTSLPTFNFSTPLTTPYLKIAKEINFRGKEGEVVCRQLDEDGVQQWLTLSTYSMILIRGCMRKWGPLFRGSVHILLLGIKRKFPVVS